MNSFIIQINDEQRRILIEALRLYNSDPARNNDARSDEPLLLQGMLDDLPADNAPGMLHGFTL